MRLSLLHLLSQTLTIQQLVIQHMLLKILLKNPNEVSLIADSYTTKLLTVIQFILIRLFAVNQPLVQQTMLRWCCHMQTIMKLTILIY